MEIEDDQVRDRVRELLRLRDLVAVLFLEDAAQPDSHRIALRALLQQTPESAAQIRYLAC